MRPDRAGRVAGLALEAGLSPVLVGLGHEAERVAAALDGLAVETVVNPDHRTGMHGSIPRGLAHVPADCAAAVVLLADMPAVTVGMVEAPVARFRGGTEPLVVPVYREVQAPPTPYGQPLLGSLARTGTGGGRRVVLEHRAEAAELRWPEAALVDVDRPEDARRLGLRPTVPER